MRKLRLFFAAAAALFAMNATAQTWTGHAPAEGTFFLYNVGADKFINNGDPKESWGTNAYLQKGFGLDFKLEANNGAYNLNTNVSGFLNAAMWCDQGATPWTFTAVSGQNNTYYISNGDSYMVANDALDDVIPAANTNDNKSWWKLVSLDDFKTAMANKQYSATNPMDVSVFIQGRSFARNDNRNSSWVTTHEGGNWNFVSGAENKYYGNEAWNNTFDVHQDIVGLPEGTYEVQCSGFGTNGTTFIYATADGVTTKKALQSDNATENYGTDKVAKWKAIADGVFAGQSTGTFTVASGNLTVGIKRDNNANYDWCVYDEFRLYYYGVDLSAFEKTLADAITAAAALEGKIPAAAYAKIKAAVDDANNKTYTTAAAIGAAIKAIGDAITTYGSEEIQAAYSNYQAVKAEVLALADKTDVYTGSATINTSSADTDVEAALDVNGIKAATTKLYEAATTFVTSVTVNEGKFFDMTNIWMVNPTVRKNIEGWTIENLSASGGSAGVSAYDETEFYNRNFDFFQNVALPAGTFEVGVTGFHRAGNHSTYFYAGEDKVLIPGVPSTEVNNMSQARDYFNAGNGTVTLKFVETAAGTIKIGIVNNDTETDKWTIFRDFTLHYYGSALNFDFVYGERWAELIAAANEAKKDYPVASCKELTDLNAAMNDKPTGTVKSVYIEKINALDAAINAVNAARSKYEAYLAYKAETITLWGSDLNVPAPTTGAEAEEAVHALNIAQYDKVAAEYTFSCTGLIGGFGTWDGSGTVAGEPKDPNYLTDQHYLGPGHAYYEQPDGGWSNSNGWTIKYTKTSILPAGSYVLKVAARSSAGTTSKMSCTATETTLALPNNGDTGWGINTSGEASWSPDDEFANNGVGRGWQWRFLPFTLDKEGEVTMTFEAAATTAWQWMSIADAELLSTTKLAKDIVYDETKENTIEKTIIADVTIKRNIVEGFNTVVLPFEMTAAQVLDAFGKDAIVYNFSDAGEKASETIVKFDRGDGSIKANTPVLVKVSEPSTEQVFKGVQIVEGEPVVAGTYYSLTGIYSPKKLTGFDYIVNTDGVAVSSKAATINGFCAYLKVNASTGRIIQTLIDGVDQEVVTGINGLFIENNYDGKIYNLNGQEVKNTRKGLYIINGKKVVIK